MKSNGVKVAISLISMVAMLGTLSVPAFASTERDYIEPASASVYNNATLEWDTTSGYHDILVEVSTSNDAIKYEYDKNNWRTSKTVNGNTVTFESDEDGDLIKEYRDGHVFTYNYEYLDGIGEFLTGFTLDGIEYKYEKDENQTVTAIIDSNGDVVAKYEYDDDGLVVDVLGLNDDRVWAVNTDKDFIGNLNLIRLYSYYYDSETGWYYCNRYYDSQNERFVDGVDEEVLEDTAENSSTFSLSSDVDKEVERLLNNSNYGKPITYSSKWYDSLTTTELLARLIYAENTSYTPDQNAIGYCLLNRYNKEDGHSYGSTMKAIATASGQFAVITGGSTNSTHARQPDTSVDGWEHATYIAVAIVKSDNDTSKCEDLFDRPEYMDYQTQFVSYSYFISNARDGSGCIQYKMGGKWNNLKDVIIPDVGTYTNLASLKDDYRNGFKGESNIHFGYK